MTLLVVPPTPDERAAAIAQRCTGFVYVVARVGVTGAGVRGGEQARHQIARLRAQTDKSLAVGLGVSSAAHAAEIASFADGVIVGSALIDRIVACETGTRALEDIQEFCSELSRGCRRVPPSP